VDEGITARTPGQDIQTYINNNRWNLDYGVTTNDCLSLSNWTHVVTVFDGSLTGNVNRLKYYINGVQNTNVAYTGTIPATLDADLNAKPFQFTKPYGSGTTYFRGYLDDMFIWKYALSPEEISGLFNSSSNHIINGSGL